MARVCPLFSGSKGNSTVVGDGSGYVLFDVGMSAKRTLEALADRDIDISRVAAIFITHDHCDHINGVRVLAAKRGIPVYATAATLDGMERAGQLNGVDAREMPIAGVEAAGLFVRSFATMHDTQGSCGYTANTSDGRKVAVATDLGIMTDEVRLAITGSDYIVIESNHDVDMLRFGPYPYALRQRIMSPRGHLSNDDCSRELPRLAKTGTTRFVLGHLSEENNTPRLALETARKTLFDNGLREGYDFTICAAPQYGGEVTVF